MQQFLCTFSRGGEETAVTLVRCVIALDEIAYVNAVLPGTGLKILPLRIVQLIPPIRTAAK